jgi:hypothetical protein
MKLQTLLFFLIFASILCITGLSQTATVTGVTVNEETGTVEIFYSFDNPLPESSGIHISMKSTSDSGFELPLDSYDNATNGNSGSVNWRYTEDTDIIPGDEHFYLVTAEEEEIPWYYYVGGGVVAGAAAFLLFSGDDAGDNGDNGDGGSSAIGTPPIRPIK